MGIVARNAPRIGAAGLAGGTVLQKRWTAGVDPRVSAAVQSGTSAVIFLPLTAILGGRFDLGPKLIASSLWLGIGMSVGALLVFVTLVARMDASRVGALLLLVPAVTAIASWPTLGEALHPLTLVGMLVAAVGVGTVLRRPTVASARPAEARAGAAASHQADADAAAAVSPRFAQASRRGRQPDATRNLEPAATGAGSGIAKICPGQPSTSKVPVGANP